MKDFFSNFDRSAASFATGILILIGVYLIISAEVPWTYQTVNSALEGRARVA